jgi:hypothetical protein
MSNALFNTLGRNQQNGNIMDIARRFQKFKKDFNGNPQEIVMNMVNSGQISQEQLNQFQQMANQLKGIFK